MQHFEACIFDREIVYVDRKVDYMNVPDDEIEYGLWHTGIDVRMCKSVLFDEVFKNGWGSRDVPLTESLPKMLESRVFCATTPGTIKSHLKEIILEVPITRVSTKDPMCRPDDQVDFIVSFHKKELQQAIKIFEEWRDTMRLREEPKVEISFAISIDNKVRGIDLFRDGDEEQGPRRLLFLPKELFLKRAKR